MPSSVKRKLIKSQIFHPSLFPSEKNNKILCCIFCCLSFDFFKKTPFLHHSEGGKSHDNCSAKSCHEENATVNSWKPKEWYFCFTNRKGRADQKYMKYSKNSPHISSFFLFVALKNCYLMTKYIVLNAYVQSRLQINGVFSFFPKKIDQRKFPKYK